MKNSIFLFLLFSVLLAQGQQYHKFIRFGYAGLTDSKGKVMVPIGQYDDFIESWSNNTGYILALKEQRYYLLYKNGKPVLNEGFENINHYRNGLFCVRKNNLYFLIDSTGTYLTDSGYSDICLPSEQLLCVYQNKKGGYINNKGKLIIPLKYENVSHFIGGFAVVKKGQAYGLIDKKEKWILPPVYLKMYRFVENFNIVQVTDSAWGILNDRQNWILKPIVCTGLWQFSGTNFLVIQKGRQEQLINVSGTTIIDNLQYTGNIFYDSLFVLKNFNSSTYYTQNGTKLHEFKNANVLYKGQFIKNDYDEKNSSYEIQANGTITKLPLYEIIAINNQNDSIIFSQSAQKKIVTLHLKSAKIQEHDFEYITTATIFGDSYYIIQKDGLYGLVDKDFRVLLDPAYTEINYKGTVKYLSLKKTNASYLYQIETRVVEEVKNANVFSLLKEGFVFNDPVTYKYGLMNYRQKLIIPAKYESLYCFDEGYAELNYYPKSKKETYKDGDLQSVTPEQEKAPQKKVGLISLQNKVITPLQWDEINAFIAGVAVVKSDGRYGALDSTGKLFLPAIYEEVFVLRNNCIRVQRNRKYGISDAKGKLLLPLEYNQIGSQLINGHFQAKKGNYYGLVDMHNKVLIDFLYLYIEIERVKGEMFYKCYKQEEAYDYYNSRLQKVKVVF